MKLSNLFNLITTYTQRALKHLLIILSIFSNKQQRYLRKLPWYIVLGSADSGKKTFVENSGLNFLPDFLTNFAFLSTDNKQLNLNWQVSKEAIILTVAGHSASNAKNLLTPALKLIKRYYRRQPLNGALCTLNLPELLLQNSKNKKVQLQTLKGTLHTIHQVLKIKLPIYLIITKCDLIAGFQEYFADFSKEDQEQIWGVRFPTSLLLNQQQAVNYFQQEFDKLMLRLQERLLLRMEQETDLNKRMLISYFPQQMQCCKTALIDFILQNESASIRGVYFVSHLQNGKPYDFLLAATARHYKLDLSELKPVIFQKKVYFLQHLFRDIILPEAKWISNYAYLQRNQSNHYASRLLASCIIISSMTALSISYKFNKDNINLIQHYLPQYQQAAMQLSSTNKTLTSLLPLLNALKNIHNIYSHTAYKFLVYLELYQPFKINHSIDTLWRHTLSAQFMPRIAIRLQNRLETNQNNMPLLYQILKGYLVFNPVANVNSAWLKPPVNYDLAKHFSDQPDQQMAIKAYLNEAIAYPIDGLPLNQLIIEQTRTTLRKVNPAQFVYQEMRQETNDSNEPFNLAAEIPVFNNIFTYQDDNLQTIPKLYTLAGYIDLHNKKSAIFIKAMQTVYWVLGFHSTIYTENTFSFLIPVLWQYYSNDYINYWDIALANIHIVPFNNLSHASQTLELLINLHNPLLILLNTVKTNTWPVRGKYLQVASHYTALNNFTDLSDKPAAQYNLLIKNLTTLHDYLVNISNTANPAQTEFQEAGAFLQNRTPANPIAVLKKQAKQLPAPLNRWINEIADNSFNLLLEGAHKTINNAWKNDVMPTYQTTIQGHFPFNKQSATDIDPVSFNNFFGNNGLFMQFFQTYLARFIETNRSIWRPYQIGKYALAISASNLSQLQKAVRIHAIYSQNNNSASLLQFSIRPRFLDPQASSVSIQLANQNLIYQHGPQQFVNWQWSISNDIQSANILFNDFQGQNASQTFDGPWAWFKLLSAGQLKAAGNSGHYIWTISQNKFQASFDLQTANNSPLFDLRLFDGFVLPETI